ncbi:type II secretion system GspH family protein [Desulfobotulus sp. H1]|uniref:Type II secretion system GspH family protein n=1 Tax=Desulfobotulus pelophilus TaxID=2823377 RepID=A0ABT3NDJ5_9BACT|nr:type II secretion system protein [Desulfobotulus pelophilus]MCW7755251.1 type II secretion system GspH family protein [Desulfobotulus pelophilus]
MKERLSNTWGFTLMELVVSMGVMGILGAVLLSQLIHHMDVHDRQKARTDTQQKVRAVLGWMEDEFRMAGFNAVVSPLPGSGVIRASSDYFAFFYRQGSGDDWKRLDYYFHPVDQGLRRKERNDLGEDGAVARLLEDVRLQFTYLDRHNHVIRNPHPEDYGRIRAVRIELGALYKDRKGREGRVDFMTTVQCRNLGVGF